MRELLQQALEALDVLLAQRSGASWMQERADKIRAELARTSWVKVSDGLPVVPEGREHVRLWLWREGKSFEPYKGVFSKRMVAEDFIATHWQYRQDDTPAPPEDL